MIDYVTNPEYFGYFDAPHQKEPAYDPDNAAPCLICGKKWSDSDVRTITFVASNGGTCYFYRVHKSCHASLSDEQRMEFEIRMISSTEEAYANTLP